MVRDLLRITLLGSSNTTAARGFPGFDPARDIPSLQDKVVLITGAAGGLGRQTAVEIARHGRPRRLYLADLPRDQVASEALLREIKEEAYGAEDAAAVTDPSSLFFLDLDLQSFESVRNCAARFAADNEQLHLLILNAGVLRMAPALTTEGYEFHFGINYLGHALLSRLLLPVLLRTAANKPKKDVRVVVISSEGHTMAPKAGVEYDKIKTDCAHLMYLKRYGQSKLALIGLMKQLSREHPQITTIAVHPGRIVTGLAQGLWKESNIARWTKGIAPLLCVPVSKGIQNHLWAATSPDVVSGTYYEPVGIPGTLSPTAQEEVFSKKLREWTDEALKEIAPL
ncbi:hypothetical protein B0I35DRAFT_480312 [Stachybotrys elegans]|uniref:NAD(P)-binding protein n=1 Tax=Stachybotrys elegans TaxID=80388 RepID=A0A8K0WQE2_9HYPO|nr:hypothetical protein B0I35DRAFT_480312 [Stachybotrys elegans]